MSAAATPAPTAKRCPSIVPAPRPRSLLPHFLAALYGFAIFYASQQPFELWLVPASGAPVFLFAPWPPRWVRYDRFTNFVAWVLGRQPLAAGIR